MSCNLEKNLKNVQLGQVRFEKERQCLVKTLGVKGQVRLCLKREDSILLKEKNLKKVWLGQVWLGQVRLGLKRKDSILLKFL